MLTDEEIESRITYHAPTPAAIAKHSIVRQLIEATYMQFELELPEGREKSLVFTKLEEAMFWANASIARNHDKL